MPAVKSTLEKMREDEREARRNLIIDSAVALFAKKPHSQVGMRDIAAQAGMSAASIYRYFADRDELFVESFIRETASIDRDFQMALTEGPAMGLTEAAVRFVEFLLDHDALFQMMTYFMVDGGISEASMDRFNRFERRLLGHLDEIFRRAGATGHVRLLSHALFAALNGLLITFRNYPGRTREETRRHLTRLAALLAGVFEKGAGGDLRLGDGQNGPARSQNPGRPPV